jgi:hypothetical protein
LIGSAVRLPRTRKAFLSKNVISIKREGGGIICQVQLTLFYGAFIRDFVVAALALGHCLAAVSARQPSIQASPTEPDVSLLFARYANGEYNVIAATLKGPADCPSRRRLEIVVQDWIRGGRTALHATFLLELAVVAADRSSRDSLTGILTFGSNLFESRGLDHICTPAHR